MYRWSLFELDLYSNDLFDFLQVEKAVKYLKCVLEGRSTSKAWAQET
jgi:hypothetical protein